MPDSNIEKIGNGSLGGKGSGFLSLKQKIAELTETADGSSFRDKISFPRTLFITTGLFDDFIKTNRLEDALEEAQKNELADCERLKARFVSGDFSDESKKILLDVLKKFEMPFIVRSSSLQEDQKGAAFAGMYDSIFVGNQGSFEKRQGDFFDAIKKVFASILNPSALTYRRKHGFINKKEAMALLVQEVIGQQYRDYFLPALAGVGFSQNGYCWNREIGKKDGLVRIVMGLGTTAVGRGYVRLFSPIKPSMRPEGTEVNNILKCSQKKVDAVDLRENTIKSIHFRELISDGFNCYPGSQAFISLRDGNYLYRPVSNVWDSSHIPVLTLDGVFSGAWLGLDVPGTLGWLLKNLEEKFGHAVDIEFAINIDNATNTAKIYLLQARPLYAGADKKPQPIPELDRGNIICSVRRNLPTAFVPDIEYLVYVDDGAYFKWPYREKQSVARVVGKIGEALKDKRFALIGPGRWGSWNPELGVPVNYSEIARCSLLVEVARRRATYVPEVSFGSHFFQDLIEDHIAYFPIYPDEPNEIFNEEIFSGSSEFQKILPDEYYRTFDNLIKVIHIPTAQNGRKAHAILNGELEQAVFFVR